MNMIFAEGPMSDTDDYQVHNSLYLMKGKTLICINCVNSCGIRDNRMRLRGTVITISVSVDHMPL